jgi:hypothetical protein
MNSPRARLAMVVLSIVAGTIGAAQATPTALVLYGPGEPAADREQRALAAYRLQSGERRGSPAVRHVGTALTTVPTLDLLTDGEQIACPGSPIPTETLTSELAEAERLVVYVRVDEATVLLDRLEGLLPCVAGTLPREELARIWFLQGVGRAYAGQDDAAREDFQRALVVAPALAWDERFPPGPQALFREAVDRARMAPSAALSVEPRVGESATLWLDGMELPAGGGQLTVAQGRHLFQWQLADGGFTTRVVEVGAGDTLQVLGRGDLASSALDGSGSPEARTRAGGALREAAAAAGVETVYLAHLGEVDLLHRYDPASEEWTVADDGSVALRTRARNYSAAGQSLLFPGLVLLAAGTVMGISGHAITRELVDEAAEIHNQEEYLQKETRYRNARTGAYVGYTLAAVGAAAVGVGIPLTAEARRLSRSLGAGSASPSAHLHLSPTGLALSIRLP